MIIRMGPDITERISAAIDLYRRAGLEPRRLVISPEVHEALRVAARKPAGLRLVEHDGVPVVVDKRFIGLNSWRLDLK